MSSGQPSWIVSSTLGLQTNAWTQEPVRPSKGIGETDIPPTRFPKPMTSGIRRGPSLSARLDTVNASHWLLHSGRRLSGTACPGRRSGTACRGRDARFGNDDLDRSPHRRPKRVVPPMSRDNRVMRPITEAWAKATGFALSRPLGQAHRGRVRETRRCRGRRGAWVPPRIRDAGAGTPPRRLPGANWI